MRNFKNNYRRNRFKSNGDRNFRKRNGNGSKVNGEFNNLDFKRRNPGRNNQNASKLVEKYNELAKEAISHGDKILSENYFQHADHFTRILSEQERLKKMRYSSNPENVKNLNNIDKVEEAVKKEVSENEVESKEDVESKISVSK